MKHTYNITGLTCNNCVAKGKSELLKLGDVLEADVQLSAPQATITMQKHIPVALLQTTLSKAGAFTITEADGGMHHAVEQEEAKPWWQTYKPILLVGAYITGLTLLTEAAGGAFDWTRWMTNFMAAFFWCFLFSSCLM